MPDTSVLEKLRHALYSFLEPNYVSADEMYLEKLLEHLAAGEGSFGNSSYLGVCTEWLVDALKTWKDSPPQTSLTAFALRVAALIAIEKKRFKVLHKEDTFNKILEVLNLKNVTHTHIRLAYVNMLSAFVQHDYGCDYVIDCDIWKQVVRYCLEDTSIYVTRDCQKFIASLLYSLIPEDLTMCEAIIKHTLMPLTNEFATDKKMEIEVNIHKENLIPVIDIACYVFETFLFGSEINATNNLLERFDFQSSVGNILKENNHAYCTGKLSKLLTILYFCDLQYKMKSNVIPLSDFKVFEGKLYSLLTLLIPQDIKSCLNVLIQAQCYWHKMSVSVVYDTDNHSKHYAFENQLIIIQLMPVLGSIVTTKASDNECLDSYCNKCFELTYESTQRLCYAFRNFVTGQENRPEILFTGVLSLLKVKDILKRDQATIIFQALMYILKDFVPEIDVRPPVHYSGPSNDEILILYPEVLSSILEALTLLIRCFHITWRESLETICIFAFMNQLLKNPNLTSKLAVKTLQLMQEVIQNFMPPNLALLVNTLDGSSIKQLGPLLFKRMHDLSWEVRDSALEVLYTVTNISEIKFTAFQEHILENQLCNCCVALATDDLESYVRASALKCLSVMVRVDKFWFHCLSNLNLPAKTIQILHNETEGIVRREAAALMKEMFEHQKVSKSLEDEVFITMATTAVKDLHWEVQINALSFWQKVIEHQMSNQGMIDGVFPPVTFSRENKKIVNLTEKEIKLRLWKVLHELSRFGCLQVLLTTLEDCNHQVVSKSASIISYVSQLLSQHQILILQDAANRTQPLPDIICSNYVDSELRPTQQIADSPVRSSSQAGDTYHPASKVARLAGDQVESSIHTNVGTVSEKVIDTIVEESDINLLQHIYQNKLSISVAKPWQDIRKNVTTDEFLARVAELDLLHCIADQNKWLEHCSDINSLLDDMLASVESGECNAVDCY